MCDTLKIALACNLFGWNWHCSQSRVIDMIASQSPLAAATSYLQIHKIAMLDCQNNQNRTELRGQCSNHCLPRHPELVEGSRDAFNIQKTGGLVHGLDFQFSYCYTPQNHRCVSRYLWCMNQSPETQSAQTTRTNFYQTKADHSLSSLMLHCIYMHLSPLKRLTRTESNIP